jgi:glycosyltransferase involved in cell wall biosynthesis
MGVSEPAPVRSITTDKRPRLSIIVPTRAGREQSLQRLVGSVEQYTTDYELVVIDREGGYNEKLNEGIRRAQGDYLAYLHDDIEVLPGWADVLAEVGAFYVGEWEGRRWWHGGLYRGYHIDDPGGVPLDYTGFMELSRAAQDKVGFWDEFFTEPYYQDADWGFQIRQAGFSFERLPGNILHHNVPGVGSPEAREYLHRKWGLG